MSVLVGCASAPPPPQAAPSPRPNPPTLSHKASVPPESLVPTAAYPSYRLGEWVEIAPKYSPVGNGWVAFGWNAQEPGSEGLSHTAGSVVCKAARDPESLYLTSDKFWMRFSKPGLWKVFIYANEFPALTCPHCGHGFDRFTFAMNQDIPCPKCQQTVRTPGNASSQQTAVSKPLEIVVYDLAPRRFVDDDEKRGEDLPVIKLSPPDGWVFTGESLDLFLHGVRMDWRMGEPGASYALGKEVRVISKVQVDFGDGTKVEEYLNESAAAEIRHQLLRHVYFENGHYEIKAVITDSKGETYAFARQVLVADKPSSGTDRLVGSIVGKLMNSDAGRGLAGKNVILYNLENRETYSDSGALSPLEDQIVQQLHKAGVTVLERDEDVLRRWAPEIFGVLPNSFSQRLQIELPEEWNRFAENFKVETARPDFLVEYRIVELNERLEPFRRFDPAKNGFVSDVELESGAAGGAAGGAGTVQKLDVRLRKRVLKLYFRVVGGNGGPESTKVVFTDTLTGSAEDFVVLTPEGASPSGGGPSSPVPTIRTCAHCGTPNDVGTAAKGQTVRCHKCQKTFEIQ
ncbi:MAG: hypothetical protein MUC63_01510 [Planctomycetes bacterium]|jgi:hypothetical protein|nr:hypothetical protein [Planctomycetota bacterium]